MEILSPVGGTQQLIAAVRSGANAVYLGLKDFNARRNAENFNDTSLEETVSYCHARNVKVYITLNTLIKDSELEKAAQAILQVAKSGADALIVQDLAIYALAKKIVPDMPLHASTQMSIHNPSGVKALEALGFSRVVPARELSLKELKKIRSVSDIELEVFVHGALCMCISGQCYLSSVLGQRSANRGLCAQPCRLDFKTDTDSHVLSLKDLSVIKDLQDLEQAGINSAKIEGRMKRPEYVAQATEASVKSLNRQPFDEQMLQGVFSRSGFTDGYIAGKLGKDMFGYRTKEDVTSAAPILKKIANNYRNENPLIPIDMSAEILSEKQSKLTVCDGDVTITVYGDVPQKAINRPIDSEYIKRSMEKCGGTQFFLRNFSCICDEGLSLSASSLNNLRKSALEKLDAKKSEIAPFKTYEYQSILPIKNTKVPKNQQLYIRCENPSQIIDEADKIILDFEKILKNRELIKKYNGRLVAELPSLMFNEEGISSKLSVLKELGITEIYAPNLYAVYLSQSFGFKTMGGFGLNILNSLSLEEYSKLGVQSTEISFETSIDSFNNISKSIPCGLIIYGKMPLMTFRNCPAKSFEGCGSCDCKAKILDRYNKEFTVLCKDRKYGRLLNPNPIYMGDKKNVLKNADFLTVYFTDENPKECAEIMRKIKKGSEFGSPYTRCLYFKEIF